MKVEKRTIDVYVSMDGKEFDTEQKCLIYERNCANSDLTKEVINRLKLTNLSNVLPITDTDNLCVYNYYEWYKLDNKKDFEDLNVIYRQLIQPPKNYPEIICIEQNEENPNWARTYFLSECKKITMSFWERFGYTLTFNK